MQSLKVRDSSGPLDNQTWHTNSWLQQKLPKFGFRTHTAALWPVEQSSILSDKFDCPVALQNFSLLWNWLIKLLLSNQYPEPCKVFKHSPISYGDITVCHMLVDIFNTKVTPESCSRFQLSVFYWWLAEKFLHLINLRTPIIIIIIIIIIITIF